MDHLISELRILKRHGCPKPGLRLILARARQLDSVQERIALYGRYCMWYSSPTAMAVDDLMAGRRGDKWSPERIAAIRDRLPLDKERRRPLMGRNMLPSLLSLERWLNDECWRDIERSAAYQDDLTVERDVWNIVREIRSFGRYIAIKMCWLLAEGEGWGHDLTTLHARDGGRYITKSFVELVDDPDLTAEAVDDLAFDIRDASADAGLDVSMFEIE